MQFATSLFNCAVQASPTAMAILGIGRAGRPRIYANVAFQELTGFTADDFEHRGLDLLQGAETDPGDVAQLQTAIAENRELRLLTRSYRKDGSWFWNLLHAIPLRDGETGTANCLLMLRDVTQQRVGVERLVLRAHRDALTGLANRHVFYDWVDQLIAQARQEGGSFGLVFVDIDHFKQINDTFGHEAGDEILKLVGARLTHGARVSDTVCRIGGDEFVLLLPQLQTAGDAASVRRRISEAVERAVAIGGYRFQLACSIGISVFPTDGYDRSSLLRSADLRMYRSKTWRSPAAGQWPVEAPRRAATETLH